jgi:hypothetical protein
MWNKWVRDEKCVQSINKRVWSEKLDGKEPFITPTRKRKNNNIKMNRKKKGVKWVHQSSSRDQWQYLVNALMNLRVTLRGGGRNFLTGRATVYFLRKVSGRY